MPKKGENIYRRKDGRWEGRYVKKRTESGKIRYGYVYGPSYRVVKEKLLVQRYDETEKSKRDENIEIIVLDDRFIVVANQWLECIKTSIKISTYMKYSDIITNYLIDNIGELRFHEIQSSQIHDFCQKLLITGGKRGTGLSPCTVANILSIVRSVFKYAREHKYTVQCDIEQIHIKQTQRMLQVFNIDEQRKLFDHLSKVDDLRGLGILLCMYTGLRIGEVCAIQWKDISLDSRSIHVQKTMLRVQNPSKSNPHKTKVVISSPKSPSSERVIPLPSFIMELLYRKSAEANFFLLTGNERYVEPRSMQYYYKKILSELKIPYKNFHTLRHTFATMCIEKGFDIKSLSEILGHSSVNITLNRYVHPSFALKQKNMEKLDPFNRHE